ncbi:aldose 1-epimerase family protein [Corynebacterium bovis]|uniref:aldose 1-epimerase family protein n=1 Tax=Corynebacterium bovis TaxID=36808 RepID=UPI000F647F8C|nr:aldose 1-epimerase family protein [Corynebacterium bovis]RRO81576.1 aldose epimerase [Corynebacterium bovis]RRO84192.1 aldose epimerase [Corynebacterium bovis]
MNGTPGGVNTHPAVTLSRRDHVAEVSTFGGGLRALRWRGRPLVEGYPAGSFPPLSANVILAPWPNRLTDGEFTVAGVRHRLAVTEPSRRTAIHGLVSDVPWSVVRSSPDAVTLAVDVDPRPGWPWPLRVTASYLLDGDGLRAGLTVRNLSAWSCPVALGVHTYLSALGAPLDDCRVELPVDARLPLDPVRLTPTGEPGPLAGVVDPAGTPLRGRRFDDCLRAAPSDGAWRSTRLTDARGDGVEALTSPSLGWFQVFTADPATGTGFPGRGRALAVEPMTAPPDALRSGTGLTTLRPGGGFSVAWRLRAVRGGVPVLP